MLSCCSRILSPLLLLPLLSVTNLFAFSVHSDSLDALSPLPGSLTLAYYLRARQCQAGSIIGRMAHDSTHVP